MSVGRAIVFLEVDGVLPPFNSTTCLSLADVTSSTCFASSWTTTNTRAPTKVGASAYPFRRSTGEISGLDRSCGAIAWAASSMSTAGPLDG